ncbi:cytochrome c3 family protein [Massilia horti]|uniref:Cytochrome C n=1 Tax=Massilia horti TaxID=2562153 RepID=A0A4Y9SQG2_9BURK|nr:cytochrome c3 family protein [Massilia horti]TFW29002.1 cytochrome C [Massilia horti]
MTQAFRPATVLVLKLGFIGFVLACAVVIALARWRMAPPGAGTTAISQPIRFSHQHHAGDDGIDCRYCHTSVEKSRFAGLPSTDICLTCHSQLFRDAPALAPLHESASTGLPIRWNRVHKIPDFAYFDHSIHISKGVACIECHGRVDRMPVLVRVASLEMQWCLACHRSAPQHVGPLSDVFLMQDKRPLSAQEVTQLNRMLHLQSTRRLTDCSTCHR